MRREIVEPRAGWRRKVEACGLTWHSAADEPYWNEGARYVLSAADAAALEAATRELYQRFLDAGQYVIEQKLYVEFGIPAWCAPLIERAWAEEPPALNYGRFDLAYDGVSPPKLLEFNCDTPTSLLEAAVVQWDWKEDAAPRLDQFNGLHDALVARWKEIAPRLPGLVHVTHIDDEGEDAVTAAYMRDIARQAGIATAPIRIGDIGWSEPRRCFVDLEGRLIAALYHLYPWEWLAHEEFGPRIAESAEKTLWIEPIWKMLWSNKAILAVLHALFPQHPNILGARRDPPPTAQDYVRKPILAREGANVTLVRRGMIAAENPGEYGEEGYVWQEYAPLFESDGVHAVIGAWSVDGEPAGVGIREGGLITGNTSRFVPHVIAG
ncbi:MAG TPA: glutathionylspermidine synthase family protein [Caulobacterales bacterium]|nr:glutathionylspermidine synthase family protein [Caulobacterales bacterium]